MSMFLTSDVLIACTTTAQPKVAETHDSLGANLTVAAHHHTYNHDQCSSEPHFTVRDPVSLSSGREA